MKIRVVYVAVTNHKYPPGRIVSVRTETESETELLRALGLPSAVWNSTMPGIAEGICKVAGPFDMNEKDLASWYHTGAKTIDLKTEQFCSTPDTPKKTVDDTLKLLQTEAQELCTRLKITPDDLLDTWQRLGIWQRCGGVD